MRESTVYASGPYYLATVLAQVITLTYARRTGAFATLLQFFDGDSLDTQGNIQDAFIHGCTVHCAAFRIFAPRLLLLLPLHDGDGDLRHRVRHDDLQLDRRHRYRDHDNDATRPAVSLNVRYVLQSAVSMTYLLRIEFHSRTSKVDSHRTLPSYLACLKYSSVFYYATEAISIAHWSEIENIGEKKKSKIFRLLNLINILISFSLFRLSSQS